MKEIIKISRTQLVRLKKIAYKYNLKNLKTTTDGLQTSIYVEVFFDDPSVRIQTPGMQQPKLYPYSKKISEADMINIIKPLVKDVIKLIKESK